MDFFLSLCSQNVVIFGGGHNITKESHPVVLGKVPFFFFFKSYQEQNILEGECVEHLLQLNWVLEIFF